MKPEHFWERVAMQLKDFAAEKLPGGILPPALVVEKEDRRPKVVLLAHEDPTIPAVVTGILRAGGAADIVTGILDIHIKTQPYRPEDETFADAVQRVQREEIGSLADLADRGGRQMGLVKDAVHLIRIPEKGPIEFSFLYYKPVGPGVSPEWLFDEMTGPRAIPDDRVVGTVVESMIFAMRGDMSDLKPPPFPSKTLEMAAWASVEMLGAVIADIHSVSEFFADVEPA